LDVALEEIIPELKAEVSDLVEAVTDIAISHSQEALPEAGIFSAMQPAFVLNPVLQASLLGSVPFLFSLSNVVSQVATGPCNTEVFNQKLGLGKFFISVTNQGDCKVSVTAPGANFAAVDKGGVGGGAFSSTANGKVKIKCLGNGQSTCTVKVEILKISGRGAPTGTWVNTSAEDANCNATPIKQKLPKGTYHITVKNTGSTCPVAIQGAPGISGAIPKGGGIGGGTFTLTGTSTDISVKCSGTGGQGPCKMDYILKRTA
jgi:hypothetical protein